MVLSYVHVIKRWVIDCIMKMSLSSCSTLFHCTGFDPDSSAESAMWPLLDRVDELEADKACLQAQLAEERERKTAEMNTSVAVVQ